MDAAPPDGGVSPPGGVGAHLPSSVRAKILGEAPDGLHRRSFERNQKRTAFFFAEMLQRHGQDLINSSGPQHSLLQWYGSDASTVKTREHHCRESSDNGATSRPTMAGQWRQDGRRSGPTPRKNIPLRCAIMLVQVSEKDSVASSC